MPYHQTVSSANFQAALTEAQSKTSEDEILFVKLEGDSLDTKAVPASCLVFESISEIIQCCPLAEVVDKLQSLLQPLAKRRARPHQPASLMQTLHKLLEELDRNYEELEGSLRAEMASLQLSLIHESTIRQALATDLKQIIDITDVDQSLSLNETANNLLNGTALFVDDALLEDTAVTHPRLAEAIRALAKYQQPTAVRFGHLQQQMYHAAKHRVTERHEIAETLKACGLSGLAKKMTQEAVFIEMSYSRPMVAD